MCPSSHALPLADASKPREAYRAAGMDDYVTKPIRVDALVEALMRAEGVSGS